MKARHSDPLQSYKSRNRGIAATASVYIAGTLVAKGARFLLIPLYVHQLARDDVGILIFLEAISIALSRALTLSLGQAVKRFYADYATDRQADNFVAALWCISFAFAIAVGGVLVAGALMFGHGLTRQVPVELLSLAIVSGILRSNIGIALERFIVRQEPVRHGLFNVGHFITTAFITVVAVAVLNLGVRGALWADIAALAIWNIVTAVIVARLRWPTFHSAELAAAARYSLPVVPHSLFTWAITFVDRLILERLVPLAMLGVYGVGYQIASLLPIFSLALVNAWIPRFFRSAAQDAGPADYARVLTLQLSAIIGIALPLIVFAPEALQLIATSEYSGAVPIVRVVAVGLIFHGAYKVLLLPLFYRKRTALVSAATGTALLVNVALNLMLIPRIGIMGAAIATLVAYASTTALVIAMVARHYPAPVDYRRIAMIVVVAALAAGSAVYSDSLPFGIDALLKLASLAIFYVPVMFFPGFLAPGEPLLLGRLRRARLVSTGPAVRMGSGSMERLGD